MKPTGSTFGLSAGIPIRRGVVWAGALVLLQMLAGTVAAENAPLDVSLRGEASPDGGVYVEWARAAGPPWMLGWHVERQLPEGGVLRVTSGRVEAGLFDPPSFAYRFHDATVQAREGDALTYRLVMVDPELREWPSTFVPIRVGPVAEAFPPAAPAPLRTKAAPVRRDAPPATVGTRVRIAVTNDGLVRLTAGQIAAVLEGLDETQVAQAIAQTNLALTCGGESVAWRAEAGGAALLFFGQAYRDTYVDQNVYWLEPGPGVAMGFSSRATASVAADPWFWETARAESNIHFMTYAPGELEDDGWIWDFRQLVAPAASGQWTTPVELTDAHPGVKAGAVTAHLVSYNDGPAALDNHTQLSAAGQLLDDRLWAGDARLSQSGAATNLGGASVSVTVGLLREADVTTTTVLIDAIDVRYARRMKARNNYLLFQSEAGTNVLTVRGFSSPSIQVFDVADPLRPVELAATVAPEGAEWRASWSANPAEPGRFLAAAVFSAPARIEGASDAGWGRPQAGAPHLVIAPRAMTNAAAALVAHRRQQGLDSLLVPIEEVYDDFAFGRRDPRAIPRFLAYAQAHWTVPPAYVCLAGDGHLDYHDHYGQALTRPNHVPPFLDRIPYATPGGGTLKTIGLDNPLADTDGDGTPDLAIGRLPAQTPAALTQMIGRIVAHEDAEDWKSRVLLVSDKDEEDAFGAARERLAAHVPPGMSIQRLGHTLATSVDTMRNSFIQGLNSGALLAVYYGHANNIGISSPHFFEHSYLRSDMPALVNGTNAPLLLAGTCMLNDFAPPHPSSRCLGKGFLDTAPGGAVAVWASAAEATLPMAEATTEAIFDELFAAHGGRLGDLIQPALDLQAHSASPWIVRANVLMGDPGTRIRTHLYVPPPPVRQAYPAGVPWAVPGLVEMENYDLGGAEAAYGDATAANEGGQYRMSEGVDIVAMAGAGNGYVVDGTPAGEWLEYTVNVASGGIHALETRVAAVGAGGQFRIWVNGVDQTGALNVPDTGAWNVYQTVSKTGVALASGIQTVRVSMATAGASGNVAAFDWFRFIATPAELEISPASTNESDTASGGRMIEVFANVSWTAETLVPWIAVTGGSGGNGDGTITYGVTANPGALSRTGGVVVAGGGIVRTCTVAQAGNPMTPVVSRAAVNVRENGEGRFFVKLDRAPAADTAVAVVWVSGDADLAVQGGGTLVFTPANWSAWQRVTLAGGDDADAAGGTATFQVAIPGLAAQTVAATELDDDIGENLARAAGGSTIAGTKAYNLDRAIDGVHTSSANYGRAVWTNVPPGTMTLDLKAPMAVTRMRLLNYDWDPRVHRYAIESSLDGTAWSPLVDASAGTHAGWEEWATNRTARYLKLTGLSNSASANVAIAEWEVYGGIGPAPVVSRATVNVRENGEGRFFVKLDRAPAVDTAVAVVWGSGDADLAVQGGGTRVFTPANWNAWQLVTLAAADDADGAGGTATFQVAIPGLAAQTVAATELDDDIGENLARAASGSTLTGTLAYRLPQMIDGVHALNANYGYMVWTNVPPGSMTLDLKAPAAVTRVRLLNYDWDLRDHRYMIESSLDGTTWSLLVDASAGSHAGWEEWATNRTARYLKLTALSNSVHQRVCIAEWEVYGDSRPAPVVSRAAVNVRENGEGRFFVKLDRAPAADTAVAVVRGSGDADLAVQGGGTLVFTPANWSAWQRVTLAGGDDADAAGGTATFQVAIPGLAAQTVAATELDDDIGENLARATGGSTIAGMKAYNLDRAIDGVHTSSANYGRAVWTNVPPGSMTLDLQESTAVTRVRLLNYDWDPRVHRYTIESSLDGTAWSPLVDASAGTHAGWEEWATNRTARYLKLTGLSNSASANVAIAEWEVYGTRSLPVARRADPARMARAISGTVASDNFDRGGLDEAEEAFDGFRFANPAVWARSGGGDWHAAPELVDGDGARPWTGDPEASSWAIALDFGEPIPLRNLDILFAGEPWPEIGRMGTDDLLKWFDLDGVSNGPVSCRAIYLYFRGEGSGTPPSVCEVRWEIDLPF